VDQRALAKIGSCVHANVYPYLANCKTSKEAWEELRLAYADGGAVQIYAIQRSLFKLRCEDYSNVETYISKALELNQTLSDCNKGISDEMFANILLGGLPSELEAFIMGIESSCPKLTSAAVIKK
jgi:hypothetical protein